MMKNKITITILLFALFSAYKAIAQNSDRALFRAGILGGFSPSNYKLNGNLLPTSDNVAGYNIGPVLEFLPLDFLTTQGSVLFTAKGGELTQGGYKTTYNANYVELPLTVRIKPRLAGNARLYFGGGVYYGFAVGGRYKTEFQNIKGSRFIRFGSGSDKDLTRTDVGTVLQAGIEFGNRFDIGASYYHGTNDVYKGTTFRASNRTLSVNAIIYIFRTTIN